MKRGDVYWVNFDPAVGGEIKKTRPAVIVSNNAANEVLNRVQVVPLTSSTGEIYPSETLIDIHGKASKAMVDQIRTISKARLIKRMATITKQEMKDLEETLRLHLGL